MCGLEVTDLSSCFVVKTPLWIFVVTDNSYGATRHTTEQELSLGFGFVLFFQTCCCMFPCMLLEETQFTVLLV